MDVSAACDVRIPGLVGGTCDMKQIYANKKQSYNSVNTATEDSVIAKLGNALSRILHVKDVKLERTGFNSLLAGDELCCAQSNVLPGDSKVDKTKLLNLKSQESSNEYGTFPCSGNTQSMFDSTNKKNEKDEIGASSTFASLSTLVPDKVKVSDLSLHPYAETPLEELENIVCEHPTTLSSATKLVSAMKGTREKLGVPRKKLTLTWAPDVYDPPPTSLSHVVKSHNRRSRSKKLGKHKHKGKSSQGSNTGKRYPKHVGKSDIRSNKSLSWDRSLFGSYTPSTLELVDIAFTGCDPNCGSSCLKTSLVGVHVPIAKATS